MAGFRNAFINSFNGLSQLIPPLILQNISNQKLILPFYHTISNTALPHIKHLYKVTNIKKFISDLDFLLKYYKPIDFNEFRKLVETKEKPQIPSFLLSFDDGLIEFYDIIAPILLKKGIPAICFLNDSFIDNKALFYRYKASLLIEKYQNNSDLFQEIDELHNINIPKYLLSINYQNQNKLNQIAENIGFDFNNYLINNKPYLTTEQIKTLIKDGFHFGAHSIDHPEYQFLNLKEQVHQTINSVNSICNKFALDYRIFSFPFTDFNITREFFELIHANENIEYTFGTAGLKKDIIPTNFQRVAFEVSDLSARRIHNSEFLYYIAKSILGKNIINRK